MQSMSMREVNEVVTGLGLPEITPTVRERMMEIAEKKTVLDAVHRASTDANARKYLEKIMGQAGAVTQSNQNRSDAKPASAPQNAQEPASAWQGGESAPQSPAPARTANAPEPEPTHSTASTASEQERDFTSFHCYGGKAALTFEADMRRSGDAHTVAIDAASAVAERQYDWKSKVRIQVTQAELPVVAAVFLGILPSCGYSQHGVEKDKSFSFERQEGGKVFARVAKGGEGMRAVPIEAPDVFRVGSLFVRQIQKNMPWLDSGSVLAMLRATLREATPPKGRI